MVARIPKREQGYSVETRTVTVHDRYQTHAPNAVKVRTFEAVENIAAGRKAVPCRECFPPPQKVVREPVREAPITRRWDER